MPVFTWVSSRVASIRLDLNFLIEQFRTQYRPPIQPSKHKGISLRAINCVQYASSSVVNNSSKQALEALDSLNDL